MTALGDARWKDTADAVQTIWATERLVVPQPETVRVIPACKLLHYATSTSSSPCTFVRATSVA